MISNKLLIKTIKYFEEHIENEIIVKPSLPILYFGDLNAYKNSRKKVLTVGKNPSVNEFKENKSESYSFLRFNLWRPEEKNLIETLNNYFLHKPLKNWFSSFEPILNGLGASYYRNTKYNIRVLHTDMCSPLATNPTWSKLNKTQMKILFEKGHEIWIELIEELQPDIMIVSIPSMLFKRNISNSGVPLIEFHKKRNGNLRKEKYIVTISSIKLKTGKKVKIIYGPAAQKPFGTITDDQKRQIGEACLK